MSTGNSCAHTCGKLEEYSKRCVVGILMDHNSYNIAFSPLVYDDGRSVPVTYISPRIRWRNSDLSPIAVETSGLMLLSCILLARIDHIEVGPVFDDLKEISDKFYEVPLQSDDGMQDVKSGYSILMHSLKQWRS